MSEDSDGARTSGRRPPEVECDEQHAGLCAPDVSAAVRFYTTVLGFKEGFLWGEPPTFAGVDLGRMRLFLQQGAAEPKGGSVYFMVGDADELFEYQRSNGVDVAVAPGDRDYGIRDYTVRDLHGYHLTFGHPTFTTGPRVPIERVDVAVRLEKRLVALLHDLAAHKRMSLSSLLEETLLHTLDGVGPHTTSNLRVIETLKQRHGIDYDTHASYRFTE